MKIYTVKTYNNLKSRHYSFSTSFKGEFENRVNSCRRHYNDITWWLYGESESRELVEKNMRNEIFQLEKDVAKKQIELNGEKSSYDNMVLNNTRYLNSKRQELTTLRNQTRNNESTITNLEKSLSGLNTTYSSLKNSNIGYNTMLLNLKTTEEKLKNENKEIDKTYKKQEESARQNLENKIKDLQIKNKTELRRLSKQVDYEIRIPDSIKSEINCTKPNGFGSIPGYKAEKEQIKKAFGEAVILEKHGKTAGVPNGILLFSPNVEFSKDFALAIANQYDCNFVSIKNENDEAINLKNIRNAATESQELFKKTNQRTLIFIENLEEFAPLEARIVGPLKSFIDKVSNSSHATIIATTTAPEKLDTILLRSGRFDLKLPLPLLDGENLREFIISKLDIDTLATIDIDEIMNKIKAFRQTGKLGLNSLNNIIQKVTLDFDINTIKIFEKQISYLKTL